MVGARSPARRSSPPTQESRACAASGIDFSLSHIDGYALIGLARSGQIGVDLEAERGARISSLRREAMIAAATGLSRDPLAGAADARFVQAWSRLEAFAKADGRGIGRTLADLGLRGAPAHAPEEFQAIATRQVRKADLIVRDVALPFGLTAAVASTRALRPKATPLPSDPDALQRLLRRHPRPG